MDELQVHAEEATAFDAALTENVGFLLESLDVIAVESLTSGNQRAAGFFFSMASLVRYFARAEELGIEQEATVARTSPETRLVS